MATTLFLLDTDADTHLGTDNANLRGTNLGWVTRALGTARGSGNQLASGATVAGPTAGIEASLSGTLPQQWISPPVSADVTISGTITLNIWAAENGMNANVAINAVIDVIRANATATRNSNTIVEIARSARTTEVNLTSDAVNNFTVTPTSTVVNRGDRIRVRVFGDDAGTMGAGFTFQVGYNGTTGGADGDTFVTFTETFSFESAPAGTQLFLTNTQSGLTAAPALISDFTGSDETPISEGGNWAQTNTDLQALRRISNQLAADATGTIGRSYWTPANFGPDVELYVTLASTGNAMGLNARIQGEGGASTWDGYEVNAATGASTTKISVVTNGSVTDLISGNAAAAWSNGDKLGMRIVGSTIQVWRQASGSGTWDLVISVVDTTYASAGKVGALMGGTNTLRMDDFYAATNSNLFTQQASTSRGAGVVSYVSDTDAGWVAPLLTTDWYTKPLTAFTLGGLARANIRALESNASADASMRLEIAVVNSDGSSPTVWSSWCIAPTSLDGGEFTTSEVARTANCSGDDLSVTDGQRLRFRLYLDNQSALVMGNAFNVQTFFNGTSAAASGDSYVTLAQTVTEQVGLILEHGFVNFNDPGVL